MVTTRQITNSLWQIYKERGSGLAEQLLRNSLDSSYESKYFYELSISLLEFFNGNLSVAKELVNQIPFSNTSEYFHIHSLINLKWIWKEQNFILPKAELKFQNSYSNTFTSSSLSKYGRFGHVAMEYFNLLYLSKKYSLNFLTDEWIGQYIFNTHLATNDYELTLVDAKLKNAFTNYEPFQLVPYIKSSKQVIDLWNPNEIRPRPKDFLSLIKPHNSIRDELRSLVTAELDPKFATATLVSIHYRLGDNSTRHEAIPVEWYLNSLEVLLPKLRNPLILLHSDEPEKALIKFKSLDAYYPSSTILKELRWLYDFVLLASSDVIYLGQSGFSRLACLSNPSAIAFQANFKDENFVPYSVYTDDLSW